MVYAFFPILFKPGNPNIFCAFIHYLQRSSLLDPDLFSLVEILKAKRKAIRVDLPPDPSPFATLK